MAVIKIRVKEHLAECVEVDPLATGSAGVDSVVLEGIDPTWDGFELTATYKTKDGNYYSLMTNGEAIIPAAVLLSERFCLSLLGTMDDGRGGEKRYTTNRLSFGIYAGNTGDGSYPPEPSVTLYTQIREIAVHAEELAQSVVDRANAGDFDGADGKDGKDGEQGPQGDPGPEGERGPQGEPGEVQMSDLTAALQTKADVITDTVSGTSCTVTDASDMPLAGLTVYGRSEQTNTPSPTSPVDITTYTPVFQVCEPDMDILVFDSLGSFITSGTYEDGVWTREAYGLTITFNVETQVLCLDGTMSHTADSLGTAFGVALLPSVSWFGVKHISGSFVSAGQTGGSGIAIPYIRANNTAGVLGGVGYNNLVLSPSGSVYAAYTRGGLTNFNIYLGNGDVYDNYTLKLVCGTGATPAADPAFSASQKATLPALRGLMSATSSYVTYTDGNAQKWWADGLDLESSKITRRVGLATFDGTESWSYASNYSVCYLNNAVDPAASSVNVYPLCDRFSRASAAGANISGGEFSIDGNGRMYIKIDGFTSKNDYTAWLGSNNITVAYALATPTVEDIPSETLSTLRALHTYKPDTTLASNAWFDGEYRADTKLWILNKLVQLAMV